MTPSASVPAAVPGAALYTHRGTRAVQRLVEYAPSTGGLALWVQHADVADASPGAAPDAPAVATDGHTLRYGSAFDKLPLDLQAGLVAHEVLHIGLRHPQRFIELQQLLGDADLQLFNVCADAIVNSTLSHLSWVQLPAGSVMLERLLDSALGLSQNVEAALLEWDVERLYRAIDDRRPPNNDGRSRRSQGDAQASAGRSGQRPASQPTAQQSDAAENVAAAPSPRLDGPRASRARALAVQMIHDLQPDPDAAAAPEEEAALAREWSERLVRAHAGDGAFSMLRTLGADLPRSRTPWEQVLRTLLARSLSPQPALSWSRPSRSYIANQGRGGPHRRMPWEPGIVPSRRVPRLVLVVDVSGSVDDALLQRFSREIQALTRRLGAGLVLVVGDDQVRGVQSFEPGRIDVGDLGALAFEGGGGTDFTPLLEEADRHRPDIGVVLTDLDGPARFRPRWPVIWAVTEAHARAVEPFGRKLVLR